MRGEKRCEEKRDVRRRERKGVKESESEWKRVRGEGTKEGVNESDKSDRVKVRERRKVME